MTECINDNLNPDFVTAIEVDYFFEEQQNFTLEVYDADDMTQLTNLKAQEFIGSYDMTLHKITSAQGQEITEELVNPGRRKCGKINIKCEEKKADFGQYSCAFTPSLSKCNQQGNIFFTINKETKVKGKYQPVFKSECRVA